jgi:hypothetical protein
MAEELTSVAPAPETVEPTDVNTGAQSTEAQEAVAQAQAAAQQAQEAGQDAVDVDRILKYELYKRYLDIIKRIEKILTKYYLYDDESFDYGRHNNMLMYELITFKTVTEQNIDLNKLNELTDLYAIVNLYEKRIKESILKSGSKVGSSCSGSSSGCSCCS